MDVLKEKKICCQLKDKKHVTLTEHIVKLKSNNNITRYNTCTALNTYGQLRK